MKRLRKNRNIPVLCFFISIKLLSQPRTQIIIVAYLANLSTNSITRTKISIKKLFLNPDKNDPQSSHPTTKSPANSPWIKYLPTNLGSVSMAARACVTSGSLASIPGSHHSSLAGARNSTGRLFGSSPTQPVALSGSLRALSEGLYGLPREACHPPPYTRVGRAALCYRCGREGLLRELVGGLISATGD